MIKIDLFNCADVVLQYGYELLKEDDKSREEQIQHLCEKILQLDHCIHENDFHISLMDAKMAARLVKKK